MSVLVYSVGEEEKKPCSCCGAKDNFFDKCVRFWGPLSSQGALVRASPGVKYLDAKKKECVWKPSKNSAEEAPLCFGYLWDGQCAGCHFNGAHPSKCSLARTWDSK